MSHQILPVAAPIDSDSAGRGGVTATQACMRVVCNSTNSVGTGFLHSSGLVITAEHVIRGCSNPILVLSDLTQINATVVAADSVLDLALVKPVTPITAPPLGLSAAKDFAVGAQVSTWGYPGGYSGAAPMLSAGYLAAMDAHLINGRQVNRWVVNAAFNSGNSGGPLMLIETGEVIGVVSSKLAPLSQTSQQIISQLENQTSGMIWTITQPDGTQTEVSEAKLIATVLNELRAQVQLVIGYAVLLGDLRSFLASHAVVP